MKTDPGAMEAMRRLGARSVPIVARGDRFVYSQSFADLRAFLGLPAEDEKTLSAPELAHRVVLILDATLRFTRQMSADLLDAPFRNSWAPPRGLAHHVFRIVEAFVEALEHPEPLTYELIMRGTYEVAPRDDVLSYGETVCRRFESWWERNKERDYAIPMATYYGDQTLLATLERTAWHAAQHARQLMVVLEANGIPIDRPLTAEDLDGLPLPEKAWDEDR